MEIGARKEEEEWRLKMDEGGGNTKDGDRRWEGRRY